MARVVHLTLAAVLASLALLTAAWAATGPAPLVGGPATPAYAVTAQATGPLVANDRDGSAVLSAGAIAPGQTVSGEVTISNAGDAAGAFTLSSTALSDPRGLASVLDLAVLDVSGAQPVRLYAGTLGAFDRLALGTLPAGAARRYHLELSYPAGRPAAVDNPLQGASTSVAFAWDAVATEGAADPTPTPAPTPAPEPLPPTPGPSAPGGSPTTPAPPASPGVVGATPGASASPGVAPATPGAPASAGSSPAVLAVGLGTARKPVARGFLVTWMTASAPARAKVTGTVTPAGGRGLKLRAVTVKLTAKRKTVRLRLPKGAIRAGTKRRLTVRLTIAATAGARKATVRRTLRVTAR